MSAITLTNVFLLVGAALVMVGVVSSLIASRFGAPLMLVFLVIGMLAGEDGPGGIRFDDFRLTYLVGSGALAVILFDGGLRTRLASFRGTLYPAILLATLGVAVTCAIVGLIAAPLLGVGLLGGLLVGAIASPTDAAAVFFLVRAHGLQLRRRLAAILEIESGTNDPVAVLFTVILVSLVLASGHASGWEIGLELAQQGIVGAAIGVAGGVALVWVLNRVTLPGGLHPLLVVASAVFLYALAQISGGSGFLAVYLAGLVVGNRPVRAFASIISFHDTVTWLCQIVMFLLLGLLVTPSKLIPHLVPALIIGFGLMFIARPLAVWLCLTPFKYSAAEKAFVGWVGLRGAVTIFLAAIPTLSNVPGAELYFNVAFVVVFASLALQGWTVNFAARRLNVALPDAAPAVKRIEIDLPGQLDDELVGYPVVAGSPVLGHGTVPSWARPLLIVRDGDVLSPAEAGVLRIGDYGYFLAPPHRVQRLDRLFAVGEGPADREIATAFPFNGDVRLGTIAELYGLEVPASERELSLADLFADRFDENLRIGSRIELGPATLFVRDLDGDRVSLAGLEFAAADETPPRAAFPAVTLRSLLAAPRRLSRLAPRRRDRKGQG
jgi:cell volume regulation protein A